MASKRILLVDDDSRNIFALSHVLKKEGYEVLTAENGNQALDALKQDSQFDVILMDMMMPEMDGYEATRIIKADDKLKHIPLVALTAQAAKKDKEDCINAGADEYMSKPINIDNILALLDKFSSAD